MDIAILLISLGLMFTGCAYMVCDGISEANDQLERIERMKTLLKGVIE